MTVSPIVLGGIATAAGGTLLVLIGIAAGRWWARREWANTRDLVAVLERNLGRAERDRETAVDALAIARGQITAMVEDAPKLWDRATRAARAADEWKLIAAEVARRQRERGGGRS